MLIIRSAAEMVRALDSPLDPHLKRLLTLRRDQLTADTGAAYDLGDLAQFVIVQVADTILQLETAVAYPLFTDPAFEWAEDHGSWIEAVTILSDDGFGIALFIPTDQPIDAAILSQLKAQVAWTGLHKTQCSGVVS